MHEKLAKTHEQLQDRFQDIRRRFAEQQERIERLEQEVRRLHEAHGAGHADGEHRDRKREEKGAKRRDEEKQGATPGANATPHVSYEGEESASL
jgi:predicted ribosome quality control (RQC) complex YloA/Tae2 family protein